MARRILPALLSTIVATALAPSAALADGQVTLNPAAGPPGTSVTLQGSGFAASRQVTVGVSGAETRLVTASRTGAFLTRLSIPHGRSGRLAVVSRRGHMRVVNTFTATPRAGASSIIEIASSRGGRVRATPARLTPGGALHLSGTGFVPGRRLALSVFGVTHRLTTHRNGGFALVVRVPATLRSGVMSAMLTGEGAALRLRLVASVATGSTTPAPPATTPSAPAPARRLRLRRRRLRHPPRLLAPSRRRHRRRRTAWRPRSPARRRRASG